MQITAARHGHSLSVSPRQSHAPKAAEEARCRRWFRSNRDLAETVLAMLAD